MGEFLYLHWDQLVFAIFLIFAGSIADDIQRTTLNLRQKKAAFS